MIKPSLLASDFVPKNAINDQVKSKTDEQWQTFCVETGLAYGLKFV